MGRGFFSVIFVKYLAANAICDTQFPNNTFFQILFTGFILLLFRKMVLMASFVPKAIPRQPTNNKHQSKNCWPLLRSGLCSAKWQRAGMIKAKRVQHVAPISDMMSANLGTRITVTPVNVTNKILKMAPNHLSSWKRENTCQTEIKEQNLHSTIYF